MSFQILLTCNLIAILKDNPTIIVYHQVRIITIVKYVLKGLWSIGILLFIKRIVILLFIVETALLQQVTVLLEYLDLCNEFILASSRSILTAVKKCCEFSNHQG